MKRLRETGNGKNGPEKKCFIIYLFLFTLKARGIKQGSGYIDTSQIQNWLDEYRLVRFRQKRFWKNVPGDHLGKNGPHAPVDVCPFKLVISELFYWFGFVPLRFR